MKNFIHEFRQFAMRGNVVDLAVGVIIGGAFGKIISSIVGDLMMPVIGLIMGGIDFKEITLGPVAIGNFIQTSVDFFIVAFIIFLVVKAINIFRKSAKHAPESAAPNREVELLTEIRDLLKNNQ